MSATLVGLTGERVVDHAKQLLPRDIADALGDPPAVPEGIGDLSVALAPERVVQRLPDLRPRTQRTLPDRICI